ncbi:MAG: hypothetical protein KDC90_07880 [Ignavibacteriae bacterium]|nr:hypothetical protein [Ignavibacteriota bacterium]
MNNLELFIKYTDDNLSSEEKEKFETKLSEDEKFSDEFHLFLNEQKSLINNAQLDERYFSSLLAKVKKRINEGSEVKNNFWGSLNIAYSIPVLILVTIIIFNLFSSNSKINNPLNSEKLLAFFTNDSNMAAEFFDSALKIDNNYLLDQKNYSAISDEYEYDDLLVNYAKENSQLIEINDSLLNKLSDNEFNLVYDELISKKIL